MRRDAEEALKLFTPDMVAAVNNIGLDFEGHVDHWFSLHVNPTPKWIGLRPAVGRRTRSGRNRPILWSGSAHWFVDRYVEPCWCSAQGGDSGLLAVQGLLSYGVQRIVLAGVPMTPTGHYFDEDLWIEAFNSRSFWLAHLDEMKPYVRSMSGWTRELFGAPECGLVS